MHISDGVLPLSVTIGGYAASAALTAWSARRTRTEQMPKLAVMTAAFFVASLISVPLGPTSVHLLIPGLTGALLGPSAFLSIGLGLLLQSLLFQFGGLTALGANALMMGLPAMACGWFFQRFKGTTRRRQALVGGLAGAAGTVLSAIVLALLLATGGEDFFGVAKLALAAHVPVIVVEGAVSGLTIGFLARVKPALLQR
jgi:cobalt/nickel transport system permease protein